MVIRDIPTLWALNREYEWIHRQLPVSITGASCKSEGVRAQGISWRETKRFPLHTWRMRQNILLNFEDRKQFVFSMIEKVL